jgi:hypothetical protein
MEQIAAALTRIEARQLQAIELLGDLDRTQWA